IDIPMKYGINQCIGDTLTPGGIMRCVRTLPVLQEISHDIMKICPKALVLNYTNPMSMLTMGMLRAEPEMNLVGLCHSVQGTSSGWAKRLDINLKDVTFECAGINHQAWFLKFEKDGKDLLPRIRELALEPNNWFGDSTRLEYVKHLGYPVTESSGHVSEYNPWFRKNDKTINKYCSEDFSEWNGGFGFIKELYSRPDWKETMKKMATWEKPVSLERSHEYGSEIIHAKVTGKKAVIYGNVKNEGLISNLPADSIVEVPIIVDKLGFRPIKIGIIPIHLAAINRTQIIVQQLAVDATLKADPEILFHAMMMDPLTAMSCTLDEIRAMTRELMQAHKEWIPVMKGKILKEQPLIYLQKPEKENVQNVDPVFRVLPLYQDSNIRFEIMNLLCPYLNISNLWILKYGQDHGAWRALIEQTEEQSGKWRQEKTGTIDALSSRNYLAVREQYNENFPWRENHITEILHNILEDQVDWNPLFLLAAAQILFSA
ncbi:MAG: hypothetical protein J7L71_06140, partial [Spirochaetaceae bacterium]|nr:hypothetical protein [Spirochaetaceae bacterium]